MLSRNILFLSILMVIVSTTGWARCSPISAGSDDVVVQLSQHPSLFTHVAYPFKKYSKIIDQVTLQRFLIKDNGQIVPLGSHKRMEKERVNWTKYIDYMHKRGIKVIPAVRSLGKSGSQKLLGNTEAMSRGVNNIISLIKKYNFDGIALDIEKTTAKQRESLTEFVAALYDWAHPTGHILMVAVGARAWYNQFDYIALSKNCDYLRVMFYDYTGSWIKGEQPGPTAPMTTWSTNPHSIPKDLDALLKMGVLPGKIIMGIPEYGYDFNLNKNGTVKSAKPYWIDQLHTIAQKHNAKIKWSQKKEAPYFDYTDSNGTRHQVWLESPKSYRAKLSLIKSRGIAGFFTWASAWQNKPTAKMFWPTVNKWLKKKPAE